MIEENKKFDKNQEKIACNLYIKSLSRNSIFNRYAIKVYPESELNNEIRSKMS